MVLIVILFFFLCLHLPIESFYFSKFKLKSSFLRLQSTSDDGIDIMSDIQQSLNSNEMSLLEQFKDNGFAIIDNFLSDKYQTILRDEAEEQYKNKRMTISKSTKWDESLQQVIEYKKHNVYSMQLSGGEQYYQAPKLHEYLVGMVSSMFEVIMNNPGNEFNDQDEQSLPIFQFQKPKIKIDK